MNGFSPVTITRFGSATLMVLSSWSPHGVAVEVSQNAAPSQPRPGRGGFLRPVQGAEQGVQLLERHRGGDLVERASILNLPCGGQESGQGGTGETAVDARPLHADLGQG